MRSLVVVLVVAAFWLAPELAAACTVCTGADTEASRKAFIGTTAFLTFFPLAMLALLIGWFVRRALASEREDEQALRGPHGAPTRPEARPVAR